MNKMKLNQQRYDFLFYASFFFLSFKQRSQTLLCLQHVNRQFMAETQFSSGEKEQVDATGQLKQLR